jgi:hypothetical protein
MHSVIKNVPPNPASLNVIELSFSNLKQQQEIKDDQQKYVSRKSIDSSLSHETLKAQPQPMASDQQTLTKIGSAKSIFLEEHLVPVANMNIITSESKVEVDDCQKQSPRTFNNVNDDLQHVHKQIQIELLKQLLKLKNISFDWFDIIIKLVWQSVHLIRPDVKHDNDSMDIRSYIKIKKLPAAGLIKADCRIVNGLVFSKNVAHKQMQQDIKTPKILLLRASIEYQRTEEKMCSLEPILAAESQYLKNYCSKLLLRQNPDILVVEKSVAR